MLSLILAAGKGTRMKSNLPKVLHLVNGKTMLEVVMDNTKVFGDNLVILGHKKELILEKYPDINYVVQEQQLGTGHAILIAKEKIKNYSEVLITYADGPLLKKDTISQMIAKFNNESLDSVMLSSVVDDPTNYGRLIKDGENVLEIKEEIDATLEEKKINEINVGVYLFKTSALLSVIDKLDNNNKKNEYYLTDVIKLLNQNNYKTKSIILNDKNEMLGVNSKKELSYASSILRQRKLDKLMSDGVIIIDPMSTYIEEDVEIGMDTTIYPQTIIQGKTKIGSNSTIYSSRIIESNIGNNVVIDNSVIEYSNIESNVTIGPYAHLRPNANLKENVHIGNFVEIKNSTIENSTKIGHLSYIGDSIVGYNTNIGAGTITCNYDGHKKNKTFIGNNSFIGSNSILVAPVTLGNQVLTAAGSVITKDVDDKKLAFGRSRQVVLNRKDI
ncbi:bifunctional UDP-N-acetylglucosamine diphosphorylase/glucosamine-1-phosphate N-acetyltransferase GlmU [Oceanivirga miroungae]|uniref:Bifunctional protein GlmU n=1 Tax=Oceanivirga miroungae TaxID=1130046 RepID=A0A6I8MBH1_9FUSO|nr:bifunctional UDP-N-acetylglucosamine diphosphorylase/glucosamine-1-phosphate N-acetyltransferase GlmU [Oceanivirga miroungae]VWL85551.1 putative acetyltransferase [Oceanivirga miroungae]